MKIICCVGLAGTGKTTLISKYKAQLQRQNLTVLSINVDPAANVTEFDIDINRVVSLPKLQEKYFYGVNGAIVTAFNLFTSKIDQLVNLLNQHTVDVVLVDFPGQIEVLTWSVSGKLFVDALKTIGDVTTWFVMDASRVYNKATLTYNLLYSYIVAQKLQVANKIVVNKMDLVHIDYTVDNVGIDGNITKSTYYDDFIDSLSLFLDDSKCEVSYVSAKTGRLSV